MRQVADIAQPGGEGVPGQRPAVPAQLVSRMARAACSSAALSPGTIALHAWPVELAEGRGRLGREAE